MTVSPSGAGSVPQLEDSIGTLETPDFSDHEPAAADAGIDLWKASSDA